MASVCNIGTSSESVRGRAGREGEARGAVGAGAGGHVRGAASGGTEACRQKTGEWESYRQYGRDGTACAQRCGRSIRSCDCYGPGGDNGEKAEKKVSGSTSRDLCADKEV